MALSEPTLSKATWGSTNVCSLVAPGEIAGDVIAAVPAAILRTQRRDQRRAEPLVRRRAAAQKARPVRGVQQEREKVAGTELAEATAEASGETAPVAEPV